MRLFSDLTSVKFSFGILLFLFFDKFLLLWVPKISCRVFSIGLRHKFTSFFFFIRPFQISLAIFLHFLDDLISFHFVRTHKLLTRIYFLVGWYNNRVERFQTFPFYQFLWITCIHFHIRSHLDIISSYFHLQIGRSHRLLPFYYFL